MSPFIMPVLKYLADHPGEIVAAAATLLSMWKGRSMVNSYLSSKRAAQLEKAAHVAFHAVEEAASLYPADAKMQTADKVAEFLDKVDTALEAYGAEPMTQAEADHATDVASVMARAQKMAAPSAPADPSKASA